MNEKLSDKQSKRPYTKPELARVSLRPEEAVLGFCKTNSQPGPAGGGGTNCASVGCFTPGT
jgi:hypothetical protein